MTIRTGDTWIEENSFYCTTQVHVSRILILENVIRMKNPVSTHSLELKSSLRIHKSPGVVNSFHSSYMWMEIPTGDFYSTIMEFLQRSLFKNNPVNLPCDNYVTGVATPVTFKPVKLTHVAQMKNPVSTHSLEKQSENDAENRLFLYRQSLIFQQTGREK